MINYKTLIFEMYKNIPIHTKSFKENIMKRFGFTREEANSIYIKINNYQVNKYDGRLELPGDELTSRRNYYRYNR